MAFQVLPGLARTFQEVPFELREGFIWINVTIPGAHKPLRFLLDTGAQVSVINAAAGKSVGMKGGGPVKVMGVGKLTTGLWPQRIEAHAGPIDLPQDFLALDLGELSEACTNGPVDGIIGADFFRDRIVQLDYEHRKVRILPDSPDQRGTLVLPLKKRRCGMLVPIRINDSNSQWVRLDTGCASAVQWVTEEIRAEDCTRRVAVGLTKLSLAVTRTSVSLGTVTFENVPTDLHSEEIFPGEKGILGNGLLSRFKEVTVDAKRGRLFLR